MDWTKSMKSIHTEPKLVLNIPNILDLCITQKVHQLPNCCTNLPNNNITTSHLPLCNHFWHFQHHNNHALPTDRQSYWSTDKAIDLLLSTHHHQPSMQSNLPANRSTFAPINLHVIAPCRCRSTITSDTSDITIITHYQPTDKDLSTKLSTYYYRPTTINQACKATYQQISRPSRP